MEFFRQVELVRQTEKGIVSSIGWIRETLARIGRHVAFEDDIDTVVWKVRNVYSRQDMESIEQQEEAHRDFKKKLARKIDRAG
jgi:hypothetical protein